MIKGLSVDWSTYIKLQLSTETKPGWVPEGGMPSFHLIVQLSSSATCCNMRWVRAASERKKNPNSFTYTDRTTRSIRPFCFFLEKENRPDSQIQTNYSSCWFPLLFLLAYMLLLWSTEDRFQARMKARLLRIVGTWHHTTRVSCCVDLKTSNPKNPLLRCRLDYVIVVRIE